MVFSEFHIDLSSGDALVGPPELLEGSDLLSFAGFAPICFPVYPVAQHLAEKLHAYTLPRDQENTRVKDLVDLVAMAAVENVEGSVLLASLQATFDTRVSHNLPTVLPEPPSSGSSQFTNLARESLPARLATLDAACRAAQRFWNPVLSDRVHGKTWLTSEQDWRELPEQ